MPPSPKPERLASPLQLQPDPSRRPVTIRPCAAGSLLLTVLASLLGRLPSLGPGAAHHRRSLVYGGDREFPPYEYLDEQGQPEGFNIHLIRALAREAGMSIEIRLGPRDERMKEFDAGKTDVMFLSYTEERAAAISCSIRRGRSRRS